VKFLVDKVSLGKVLLCILKFSLPIIIPVMTYTYVLAQTVKLPFVFLGYLAQVSTGALVILSDYLHGFPQSFYIKFKILPCKGHDILPLNSSFSQSHI
jgi:hypothetical protein